MEVSLGESLFRYAAVLESQADSYRYRLRVSSQHLIMRELKQYLSVDQ